MERWMTILLAVIIFTHEELLSILFKKKKVKVDLKAKREHLINVCHFFHNLGIIDISIPYQFTTK